MAYITIERGEIDTSLLYTTIKELVVETGIPQASVRNHIQKDYLDALRFRNKTFIHPEEAQRYKELVRCGIITTSLSHEEVLNQYKDDADTARARYAEKREHQIIRDSRFYQHAERAARTA